MEFDQQIQPRERISVLTTQPLPPLDYLVGEEPVSLGNFVKVPLGSRTVLGVIWAYGEGALPREKLREVSEVVTTLPVLNAEMREFLSSVALYTMTPLSSMLRMATRAPGLMDPVSQMRVLRKGEAAPARMTDARARVLSVFDQNPDQNFTARELCDLAEVSQGVLSGLIKSGAIAQKTAPRDQPYDRLNWRGLGNALSSSQAAAAKNLSDAQSKGYRTVLLQGVTGSGKTEVYLEAIAACLAQGRQALVLLPEIALTVDFLARLEARFGAKPAEWHYGIRATARRRCWHMVAANNAQIVVGARSALFLPFYDLGLIVVDEEHDGSYKQDDGVLYSARDMAVMRAARCGAQVVLASATPALETWVNAKSGKYDHIRLAARFGNAVLPNIQTIDMREEQMPPNHWISPRLAQEIDQRLKKGEQSMLFLNRRGYAPITVCRNCRTQLGCRDCDARLVEHRFRRIMMCHQCGETQPIPRKCPSCGHEGDFATIGPGVERISEEAAHRFPSARIALLSSDMMLTGEKLRARIQAIASGAADIIIGTQLVAKGHNFPLLTCVGIIDADLGLQGGDLRASERSFQLIRQVSGRAGRSDRRGTAYIQTCQPEHPVIKAILAGDEDAFWGSEARARQSAQVPPFGRLAGIILSGEDEGKTSALAQKMSLKPAPLLEAGLEIYGPAPAPIARIKGRSRFRLLIKGPKSAPLQRAIKAWVAQFTIPPKIRLQIDIDPQSFY